MVTQIKWIKRTFNFDFPVGLYPGIMERLAGTPARVEEKLSGVDADILTHSSGQGWTVQEHVGHLLDLEDLLLARLHDFENRAETLTPADMTNRKTNKANHNTKNIEDILSQFRETRQGIVKRMQQYDEEMAGRSSMHPRLRKPTRVIDLAYFFAEHDDHHLATMTRLLKAL